MKTCSHEKIYRTIVENKCTNHVTSQQLAHRYHFQNVQLLGFKISAKSALKKHLFQHIL